MAERMGGTLHGVTFMTDQDHSRPRHLQPPPGPAGTCGLVMISRLPVLSFADLLVPKTAGDVVEQRRAIVAEVEVAGTTVAIGGLHASHRIWGSIPQLRVLDTDLRRRGHPSVIAGDCNMWGPPIRAALPHRTGAVRGRTWPSWRPHSQIDHIWIDDRLEALTGRVGPRTGSDHRPISARLHVR
jgi:endonuclease/exonuclease/phosphatase family metal-dependent hydrolase